MLAGLGRARFILVVQLLWLAALVPAIALGVHRYGIVGAAAGHIVVIAPIVLPVYVFGLRKIASVATLAKAVLPAFLAAVAAGLAAAATASLVTSPEEKLAVGLSAGGLVYLVLVVPQVRLFLSPEQISRLHLRRVLRPYATVAWLAGLGPASQAKHAASPGMAHPEPAVQGAAAPGWAMAAGAAGSHVPQQQSREAAMAAIELLISFSRPENAAPGPVMRPQVQIAPTLARPRPPGQSAPRPVGQPVGLPD
jgi:hypothetical protein